MNHRRPLRTLRTLVALSLCGALYACPLPAQSTGTVTQCPEAISLQESFSRVAAKMDPAVVNISTVVEEKEGPGYEFFFGSPFEQYFGNGEGQSQGKPQKRRVEAEASGVIISPDGHILTNEHVVHDAKVIRVTMKDGKKYKGKIVGKDARTDLAIIKIDAGKELPAANLGDSDQLKIGDWVVAIGSPFGLESTVTAGIVSAKRQSLSIEGNTYNDLLQTDAAINRGNSGGPLCNINGDVIGINTAIFAPTGVFSGIGFAIPINNAKTVMASLIQKGKVVRGWLGVEVQPVNEVIAKQFSLPDSDGALVGNVVERSPADMAGIQRGDVIREVEGKKIKDPEELQTIVAQVQPNKTIQVGIIRDKKEMKVRLTAGEMPQEVSQAPMKQPEPESRAAAQDDKGKEAAPADWQGTKIVTLTEEIVQRFHMASSEKGCLVVSVNPATPADDMGLMPGDIIRSVNKTPTPTAEKFMEVIKSASLAAGVMFDVNRQGTSVFLTYSEKENKPQ